jgi:hypothetical protein
MNIFQQEYYDGIADLLTASKSHISFASLATPSPDHTMIRNNFKSSASYNDDDLYYVQSILVTSNWNKNDDIFDAPEVWAARKTPEDKPTNLEHDEKTIVGHIVSNWAIDEAGQILDETMASDDLPSKFHIITGSVIYRAFTDPELKSRAENLIQQIENGQKYVSMECYFKGFDYGLRDAQGNLKVVARNQDTAFLTKHLRAYGGTGQHEDYQIGRVLRSITFSGKGFVDKPANPESIIFNKDDLSKIIFANEQKKPVSEKTGVLKSNKISNSQNDGVHMNLENEISQLQQTMASIKSDYDSSLETSKSEIEQLKSLNNELKQELDNTMSNQEELSKANEEKISALEAQVAELKSVIEQAEATKAELAEQLEANAGEHDKKMKEKEEELKSKSEAVETLTTEVAQYKEDKMKMEEKMKKDKRMATLVEAGMSQEEAEKTEANLNALSDEQFDSIAETFKASLAAKNEEETEAGMPPALKEAIEKKKEKEEESKAEQESEEVDASVLEDVELAEEADLSVGSEVSEEVENTRAALVDFVYNRLGKTNQKGE